MEGGQLGKQVVDIASARQMRPKVHRSRLLDLGRAILRPFVSPGIRGRGSNDRWLGLKRQRSGTPPYGLVRKTVDEDVDQVKESGPIQPLNVPQRVPRCEGSLQRVPLAPVDVA